MIQALNDNTDMMSMQHEFQKSLKAELQGREEQLAELKREVKDTSAETERQNALIQEITEK